MTNAGGDVTHHILSTDIVATPPNTTVPKLTADAWTTRCRWARIQTRTLPWAARTAAAAAGAGVGEVASAAMAAVAAAAGAIEDGAPVMIVVAEETAEGHAAGVLVQMVGAEADAGAATTETEGEADRVLFAAGVRGARGRAAVEQPLLPCAVYAWAWQSVPHHNGS